MTLVIESENYSFKEKFVVGGYFPLFIFLEEVTQNGRDNSETSRVNKIKKDSKINL